METIEWTEEGLEEKSGYVKGPLMTIGEAAKYLGVSRKTVYALLESGRLPGLKGKKSVKLISKESLDGFRRSGELT